MTVVTNPKEYREKYLAKQKELKSKLSEVDYLELRETRSCLDGWYTADELEAIVKAMRVFKQWRELVFPEPYQK